MNTTPHHSSKPEHLKLNRQLKVYVTRDEELDLKQEANLVGMSFSSYARAVLINHEFEFDPKELRRIRFELNKLGVNLNQLTRKANETNDLPALELFESLRNELIVILDQL